MAKEDKVQSEKIRETLLLTLATLARRSEGQEVAVEITGWLTESLSSCKSDPCRLSLLRAMRNLRAEGALPILMQLVHANGGSKKSKVPLAAVRALQGTSLEALKKHRKDAESVLLTAVMY